MMRNKKNFAQRSSFNYPQPQVDPNLRASPFDQLSAALQVKLRPDNQVDIYRHFLTYF
jgi:hypothetical protein